MPAIGSTLIVNSDSVTPEHLVLRECGCLPLLCSSAHLPAAFELLHLLHLLQVLLLVLILLTPAATSCASNVSFAKSSASKAKPIAWLCFTY